MNAKLLTKALTVLLIIMPFVAGSQSIIIPNGTSGIGTSGNSNIGIGYPNNGTPPFRFDVAGDVRLNGSPTNSTDGVVFAKPNAEQGLAIFRDGFNNRADARFDGNFFRLLVGVGTLPPPSTNGITITTAGNVGVGGGNLSTLTSRFNVVNGNLSIWNGGLNGTTYQRFELYADAANGLWFDAPKNSLGNRMPISFAWRGENAIMRITSNRNVGIGTITPDNAYQLHVDGTQAGYNKGILATISGQTTDATAILGQATNFLGTNIGVNGVATGGSLNYGGYFNGTGGPSENYGVQSSASGGNESYGGYFTGQNSTYNNYGIRSNGYGGVSSYGGYFKGEDASYFNAGVYSTGRTGQYTYGGYFLANSGTDNNHALYGAAEGGDEAYGALLIANGGSNKNFGVNASSLGGSVSIGGSFHANSSPVVYGVDGRAFGMGTSSTKAIGGQFAVSDAVSTTAVNALATAHAGNDFNYGVTAIADAPTEGANFQNIGVKSSANANETTDLNAGVYSIAVAPVNDMSTVTNYGVYGSILGGKPGSIGSSGSFAGYFWNSTSTPNTGAGFFNGDVWRTGNDNFASDIQFKENVKDVEDAMVKIMKLSPSTYTFKGKEEFPSFTFPKGNQYGFIAQELEQVFPELVTQGINPAQYDEKGNKIADAVNFKGVRYTSLIPVLTAGIQEQQEIIDVQNSRLDEQEVIIEQQNTKIAELEQAIAEIKAAINGDNAQPQPRLEGRGSSNQMNLRPNPTNGKANIDYVIKGAFQNAKVEVYSTTGQLLGEYRVNSEGIGNVEIDTTAWAGGTYFCKLIVDNAVQDTKKLVVSK